MNWGNQFSMRAFGRVHSNSNSFLVWIYKRNLVVANNFLGEIESNLPKSNVDVCFQLFTIQYSYYVCVCCVRGSRILKQIVNPVKYLDGFLRGSLGDDAIRIVSLRIHVGQIVVFRT